MNDAMITLPAGMSASHVDKDGRCWLFGKGGKGWTVEYKAEGLTEGQLRALVEAIREIRKETP